MLFACCWFGLIQLFSAELHDQYLPQSDWRSPKLLALSLVRRVIGCGDWMYLQPHIFIFVVKQSGAGFGFGSLSMPVGFCILGSGPGPICCNGHENADVKDKMKCRQI